MATVTVATLKDYLRIQHTAEDVLLEALLSSARAIVSSWLQRPLAIEERTFLVETKVYHGLHYLYTRTLYLPMHPMEALTSIEDVDGVDVSDDVTVDYRAATIRYNDSSEFENGPYTIMGTFGLAAYDEYEASIEPAINQALIDVAADLYQRRNPAAASEAEGGGVVVSYWNQTRGVAAAGGGREDLLPPRVAAMLAPWRAVPMV